MANKTQKANKKEANYNNVRVKTFNDNQDKEWNLSIDVDNIINNVKITFGNKIKNSTATPRPILFVRVNFVDNWNGLMGAQPFFNTSLNIKS